MSIRSARKQSVAAAAAGLFLAGTGMPGALLAVASADQFGVTTCILDTRVRLGPKPDSVRFYVPDRCSGADPAITVTPGANEVRQGSTAYQRLSATPALLVRNGSGERVVLPLAFFSSGNDPEGHSYHADTLVAYSLFLVVRYRQPHACRVVVTLERADGQTAPESPRSGPAAANPSRSGHPTRWTFRSVPAGGDITVRWMGSAAAGSGGLYRYHIVGSDLQTGANISDDVLVYLEPRLSAPGVHRRGTS